MKSLIWLISLILVFSFTASAQSAAEKSWKPFWTKFTAAVKSKNKAAIKQLMVTEKDFSDGNEGETRNQWLEYLDKQKQWRELQKIVAKGTKLFLHGDKRPWKITTDESPSSLLFVFEKGRWRFWGFLGYGE